MRSVTEKQCSFLEPLLALTLSQPGAVFDIPRQLLRLHSSSNLGFPETNRLI